MTSDQERFERRICYEEGEFVLRSSEWSTIAGIFQFVKAEASESYFLSKGSARTNILV